MTKPNRNEVPPLEFFNGCNRIMNGKGNQTIVYTVNYASVGVLLSTTLYIRSMPKLSIKAALFSVLHWQQGAFQSNLYVHCEIIHCQQTGGCFFIAKKNILLQGMSAAQCISAMYDFVITGVVIESVPVGQISRSLDFVARICCDVVVDPIATQRRDKVNLLYLRRIFVIFFDRIIQSWTSTFFIKSAAINKKP